MTTGDILLQLVVAAICFETGRTIGKPTRDRQVEERRRRWMNVFLSAVALIGIIATIGAFFISVAQFVTIVSVTVGLLLGFVTANLGRGSKAT
jgi:small-conductance mechanosensitive channel